MKKIYSKSVFLVLTFFLLAINVKAQSEYKLDLSKSKLTISGTSTLHNWHMTANNYICDVYASMEENKDILISKIEFECKAQSITSDNSLMDDKAHEALKTNKFPNITFLASQNIKVIVNREMLDGLLNGTLQISGENKSAKLPFKGEIDNAGNLKIHGETSVLMSDYKIKAPTALMGSIKTGDEITIHYDFYFTLQKLAQNSNN
jgi:polyisoprenoid-binding protein YceI